MGKPHFISKGGRKLVKERIWNPRRERGRKLGKCKDRRDKVAGVGSQHKWQELYRQGSSAKIEAKQEKVNENYII